LCVGTARHKHEFAHRIKLVLTYTMSLYSTPANANNTQQQMKSSINLLLLHACVTTTTTTTRATSLPASHSLQRLLQSLVQILHKPQADESVTRHHHEHTTHTTCTVAKFFSTRSSTSSIITPVTSAAYRINVNTNASHELPTSRISNAMSFNTATPAATWSSP
jgi:hypothetical protein